MNTSEIEVLLEKFYEGETSLQEERMLRDFFREQRVPAHLLSHQPLFAFMSAEQQNEITSPEFDQKLTSKLLIEPDKTPVVRLLPQRPSRLIIMSIAAGILLLVGLFLTIQLDVFKNPLKQSGSTNSEISYADASQALMLVSANFNTGLKQVERLQMVDNAMKNVQLFNKFYQVQTLIINPDEISNQSIKSK
ncbi:MAG: hypothetical protein WCJ26_06990 [bacterium]